MGPILILSSDKDYLLQKNTLPVKTGPWAVWGELGVRGSRVSAQLPHVKETLALWPRVPLSSFPQPGKTWWVLFESKFQLLLVSLHLCPWGKETIEVTGSVCHLGGP